MPSFRLSVKGVHKVFSVSGATRTPMGINTLEEIPLSSSNAFVSTSWFFMSLVGKFPESIVDFSGKPQTSLISLFAMFSAKVVSLTCPAASRLFLVSDSSGRLTGEPW
ncbi:hypothetical protein GDO78_008158 [Eleutherodactylus coqui]|uniref:Uncharacterized protein n=1 Tax=Eleutherodactylus coqui TaxID=57060 RepID=A0A8J6FDA0_ELECQ|nr:hypothetical protein GDO78_008158 [Eleutherodactylus coqui]